MKKNLFILASSLVIVFILGILEYNGYIWHTGIFTKGYDIRGLDVSHYQKVIEWDKVPKEQYKFIFMKATEGEDMVDNRFNYNWSSAKNNGFLVGAYHFFVTSSTGKDQANNFINTVPVEDDALPPVIDIEISKDKDKESVRKNLTEMIDMFWKVYKKKPILYVTYDTYNVFVMGYFDECDIWIRDIIKHPNLKDRREWKFWQYSNRGRVSGIDSYVDKNVFYGSEDDFRTNFLLMGM